MNKKICEICGSEKFVQKYKDTNLILCSKHKSQMDRHGKILNRTIKDLNEIVIYDNYAEVILYNKQCEEVARAIIDIEDIDKVKNFNWCLDDYGYAHSSKSIKRLHQLLIDYDVKINIIDHIDKNKLNNRKCNLRICTKLENNRNVGIQKNNTSGFIGVTYDKKRNCWVSQITVNYKNVYLGSFLIKEEAVKIRLEAELKYFGEFAPQKDLFKQYEICEENHNE